MTLPNDHTVGADPTNPTPETMCSINDEATGMVIDALVHYYEYYNEQVSLGYAQINRGDPRMYGVNLRYTF